MDDRRGKCRPIALRRTLPAALPLSAMGHERGRARGQGRTERPKGIRLVIGSAFGMLERGRAALAICRKYGDEAPFDQ